MTGCLQDSNVVFWWSAFRKNLKNNFYHANFSEYTLPHTGPNRCTTGPLPPNAVLLRPCAAFYARAVWRAMLPVFPQVPEDSGTSVSRWKLWRINFIFYFVRCAALLGTGYWYPVPIGYRNRQGRNAGGCDTRCSGSRLSTSWCRYVQFLKV